MSFVIVLLICTSTPASRQLRTPRTAPSKAPGTPRNSSCSAALGKSIEMLTRAMPMSCMRRATSGVTSVPLGDITVRSPLPMAYSAMSKMSARISGSPPVRMRIGLANEAIWSTRVKASAVLSSPS